MASTTKKGSKNKKTKPRRPVVKTSPAKRAQTNAELRQELEARNRDLAESLQRESSALKKLQDRDQQLAESAKELQDCQGQLTEALEQQTATSEILGVIASSPTDIQPVLDVVAATAARLCEAADAQILRIDGDILRLAASYGSLPTSQTRPLNRQLVSGRAVIDRQTIHVNDIALAEDEFPYTKSLGIPRGIRTFLGYPTIVQG